MFRPRCNAFILLVGLPEIGGDSAAPGLNVAFGNGIGRQWLWVSEPINKSLEVKPNNGAHFALIADSLKTVNSFYKEAIAHGGFDAGPPGLRQEYMPTYYGAFVFDPDGNKIEAVCRKNEKE